MANSISERRYDIDWLRVIAVLLLFFYHPARLFYIWGGWYIQSSQKSVAVSIVLQFIDHWHMPLLFLLAGASTYYALGTRNSSQYLGERLKRLLVPLIFGVLVIVPPQIYLNVMFRGIKGKLSYLTYFPGYFTGTYTDGFDMGHLWFIAFLFGFSLVALPLFTALRRPGGKKALTRIGRFLSVPGMILLPALPLMAANYAMLHSYPNPLYFFVYFLFGYLLTGMESLKTTLDKGKLPALGFSLGMYVLWVTLVRTGTVDYWWLQPIPRDLIGWSFMVSVLGYGQKYLNSFDAKKTSGKFLTYFAEASYPLYILHQTAAVAVAFWVVKWDSPIIVKLPVIVVGTFVSSLLVYDLLIKRTAISRFLMGMRPKKRG